MKVLILKPHSPFHIQGNRHSSEFSDHFPKSDTISSAIMSLWFRDYGHVPGFPESTPFRIGSGFPAVFTGVDYQFFFPKPIGVRSDTEILDRAEINPKDLKKVRYIDTDTLRLLGNDMSFSNEVLNRTKFGKESAYLGFDAVDRPVLKSDVITRVVLDRVTNASTPYHFARVHYAEDTRIWIPFEVDVEVEKEFYALVRLLGDEGIGGDRTSGHGLFAVEDVRDVVISSNNQRWLSLGLMNPTQGFQSSVAWAEQHYELTMRQGWISNYGLRRKPVMMINEGSVFCVKPEGRWVKVLEPSDHPALTDKLRHPVYRDGRGFFITF